jgi:hypothetical protein
VKEEEFEEQYQILVEDLDPYNFEQHMIRVKGTSFDDQFFKEKAVIFLYSTDTGRDLNNKLRQGMSNKKLMAFKSTLHYSLENIKKCPSYRNVFTEDLYRGSRKNYDGIAEKNIGDTFILTEFLSTTHDSSVANIFEEGVKIFVNTTSGTFISQYSESPEEHEVLINTGIEFNVWNKTNRGEIEYIYIDHDKDEL